MSKLPVVSGRDVIKALQTVGFEVARVEGSHHILKKPDFLYLVTVRVHGNKPLRTGTLRQIIRTAGLTVEEFAVALGR